MKAIISHDVDHLTVWEHKKDLIIPKFIGRTVIERAIGKISTRETALRLRSLIDNKWQNLESLMQFDKEHCIPSTFFIAVNNGLKLAYSLENAKRWIREIEHRGFDVGVHGIDYDTLQGIEREKEMFSGVSQADNFGIRIHYLRTSADTLEFLDKSGYLFDSTIYQLKKPFQVGNLWEFPLHLMDSYLVHKNNRWQNQTLAQVKEKTKETIERCQEQKIEYFTILFHSRGFNEAFRTWQDWYTWLIEYLRKNHIEIISYKQAIKELKG